MMIDSGPRIDPAIRARNTNWISGIRFNAIFEINRGIIRANNLINVADVHFHVFIIIRTLLALLAAKLSIRAYRPYYKTERQIYRVTANCLIVINY
jgi:hypothetical protein